MDFKALKQNGKGAFLANRWPSIAASLALSLASCGLGSFGRARGYIDNPAELPSMTAEEQMAMVAIVASIIAVAVITTVLLSVFLLAPLEVGCQNFFRQNQSKPAELSVVASGFKDGYGANALTMFLKNLFLFCWTCLFVIPGIVKSYSYRFVPYIRKEYPELKPTEVIKLSRDMMNGHKKEAFLLDLSFIGWGILSAATCGLVWIFYAGPYYNNTCAAYYEAVKSASGEQA